MWSTGVGPDHPDFNDFGFGSEATNGFFQNYMERVSKLPESNALCAVKTKPKVSAKSKESKSSSAGKSSAKKAKETNVSASYSTSETVYNPKEELKLHQQEKEKQEMKPKRAPRSTACFMDFKSLMQLAEKNSTNADANGAGGLPKRKKSPERLLTAKEKLEQKEREQRQLQRKQNNRKVEESTQKGSKKEARDRMVVNAERRAAASIIFAKTNPKPKVSAESQAAAAKKRIRYENDSEYDSDLDDFIDDSELKEDISPYIRNIFGYDKRKYRNLDEDDDKMESSFAQMQREEFISKKLGMQEDLEDMRQEKLAKTKKLAKKRKN